jgi:peptide/nickel transport system permease protein
MLNYIIRRLLYAVPILIGVMLVTFVLFYVVVSPTVQAKRNLTSRNPTQQEIQTWLKARGYDKPVHIQFLTHMKNLLLFNFGKSDDPSGERIGDRLRRSWRPSFLIAAPAFLIGLGTSVALAIFVAYYRATYLDFWGTVLAIILMSLPAIFYVIGAQFLFGRVWRLAPLAGFDITQPWKYVALPILIGVVGSLGANVRFYRTVMLEEMNQDYVRTARAKGVPESMVLFRHVLKNAAIPIITSSVLQIPFLMLGSLLMENFFSIPGLGGALLNAVGAADFATVRAMVYLGAVLYIVGALMTDVLYAVVNPRVRLE